MGTLGVVALPIERVEPKKHKTWLIIPNQSLVYCSGFQMLMYKQVFTNLKEMNFRLIEFKFRLKLKKVGKTTKPFRCDLNKIPNDYTVDMRNRFKG